VAPKRDDLFAIFPDLPWFPPRPRADQVRAVRERVERMRRQVRLNIARQKDQAEAVRTRVARRTRSRR
jgi:hypothetical protein